MWATESRWSFRLNFFWITRGRRALGGTTWTSLQSCGRRESLGREHADDIATAMEDYTRYNGRRKPDPNPSTFSLANYGEAALRLHAGAEDGSTGRVDKLAGAELPEKNERASYFELIQYPVDACANLTEMYIAAAEMQQMRNWGIPRRTRRPTR